MIKTFSPGQYPEIRLIFYSLIVSVKEYKAVEATLFDFFSSSWKYLI